MILLRMRGYGDDRNHSSLRAVIPEDPVGSWCFLLDIRLEDFSLLGPVRDRNSCVFREGWCRLVSRNPRAFPDGFKNIPLGGIVFNLQKVGVGLGWENQFGHGLLFSTFGERSAMNRSLLRKPGQDFL
jgi:hypothetical protein